MSHDTDKLIRQLSLVAFLMAERRPLTARDIKSNVEGYQEMSDEAFARRFYSDRAELVALGVPLDSQRDEFTGEELYTLRSERYFLPELELDDDELAALQTCFYLLEGRFAYAEPLRLALQNLALGRSAGSMAAPPTGTAGRVEVRDPDYSPELQGRLGKLEGAISKQRTVKFRYWSIYRDEEEERTLNPYALLPENGSWYVIGHDLERKDIRTFRVSRIRSDIRFATRRERDFRLPPEFDVEKYRGRAEWQFGDIVGEARVEVAPDTAWWVERVYDGARNRLEGDVFVTEYASLALLARWILRQDGRAIPLEPSELRRLVTEGARAARRAHEGPRGRAGRRDPARDRRPARRAPRGPGRAGALRRPAVAARLPPHRLRRRARGGHHGAGARRPVLDPARPARGASLAAQPRQLRRRLLRRLRRAARRRGARRQGALRRHVPPAAAADAARGARDPAGARVRRPDGRRRRPLPARARPREARGDLRRVRPGADPALHIGAEEDLVAKLTQAIDEHKLVEIEYLKPEEQEVATRTVEPYSIERRLPFWYVHTWDTERDQARSYRLDRMRRAKVLRKTFRPRDGFDPAELRGASTARIWYSPAVARWEVEKGARRLVDGSAIADRGGRQRRLAGRRGRLLPRRGDRARAARAAGTGRTAGARARRRAAADAR